MDLTDRELGTLRSLILKEAKSLGYGGDWTFPYHPENKQLWPRRLRRLATLANKIGQEQRERRSLRIPLEPPW